MTFKFTKTLLLLVSVFSSLSIIAQPNLPQLGKNPISEIVKAMTLEEKVNLLVGQGMYVPGMPMPGSGLPPTEAQKRVTGAAGTTAAIPRFNIPALVVCDGPAGIHAFNGGKSRLYYATAWPIGTLLASSWDTALVKKVGIALGEEAKEFGIDILLGPGMNIHRNPLGARNFEYYSEDPFVTGTIAAAMINGIQYSGVGTSAKHFFANNQETNRNSVNTIISERAMREIYLKGWQIAIKASNPWTIMSSYNLVNGPYTSENPELLRTILRKEWGYKGFVMTDWFGGKTAIAQQIAGNHLIMPGLPPQKKEIIDAVKNKILDEAVLDQNVTEILNIILETPSFKGYKFSDNPPLKENAQLSREAAAASMVLLKNEGNALPIKLGTNIAVFGNNQIDLVAGGTGSGDVTKMYTAQLADGLFNAGFGLHTTVYRAYSSYMQSEKAKQPKRTLMEDLMSPIKPIEEMSISNDLILKAASESAIALIAIGRNAGEGNDRKENGDYYLTEKEKSLIKLVSAAFHAKNKKVVVTLNIGGVIDLMQWRDQVDAILLAWQPGLEGGNAIADVVCGKVNPSGKLATTFPAKYSDDYSSKNFPGREIPGSEKGGLFGQKQVDAEVIYEEGIYVGYRYFSSFKIPTAYPFGFGLSYTKFKLSNLTISSPVMNDQIKVNITVTNTGKVAGKEVAELYISAPVNKLDKPALELKSFAKTKTLQPGESQILSFILAPADLTSFNTASSSFIVEAGDYTIHFGNAEQSVISSSFKVTNDIVVEKVNKVLVPKIEINELKKVPSKK
ncbi:MAG: glycoside hydrolase family 3 C-terminal domain-containing protein [Sediminibacterium sp.]|uniref:beta-glucosidase n=1 Tax=Sediminibacterium sp. TaxID=1917865 RepID=UPI002729211C|nr:glycoside hydrolase family 3 C-terminal domain-containing protein [Sediminibacterium sp.]MDO8996482.1 glycoside hydrolase family 3 C-terminal domain-containing protein [Sediminibacterium sp.]